MNVRAAAADLADEVFHADVWANRRQPTPDGRFQFQEAVSYIVDDLDINQIETLVGDVFLDHLELDSFQALASALNVLLSRIGSRGSYSEAASAPEWSQVRSAARRLLEVLE